jgi:hypothetical protein
VIQLYISTQHASSTMGEERSSRIDAPFSVGGMLTTTLHNNTIEKKPRSHFKILLVFPLLSHQLCGSSEKLQHTGMTKKIQVAMWTSPPCPMT